MHDPHLRLAGIEGYEGSMPGASESEKEQNIARFVGFMGDVARECARQALLDADPILLSAGGSAYFDMVTALPRSLAGRATQIVIRSGCYLTHDSDAYAQAARADARADAGAGGARRRVARRARGVGVRAIASRARARDPDDGQARRFA